MDLRLVLLSIGVLFLAASAAIFLLVRDPMLSVMSALVGVGGLLAARLARRAAA